MMATIQEAKRELGRLDESLAMKTEVIEFKADFKQDLADFKAELLDALADFADDIKRHFDVAVEQFRSDRKDAVELQLKDHEHRIRRLENNEERP